MADKLIPITKEVLQFDAKFQEAVVGHVLSDYTFFLKAREWLEPSHFQDPLHQVIIATAFKMYDNLNEGNKRHINNEEVLVGIADKHPDAGTRQRYRTSVDVSVISGRTINIDIVAQRMTTWIKLLKLKNCMIAA